VSIRIHGYVEQNREVSNPLVNVLLIADLPGADTSCQWRDFRSPVRCDGNSNEGLVFDLGPECACVEAS
jgi:hypothetical protein